MEQRASDDVDGHGLSTSARLLRRIHAGDDLALELLYDRFLGYLRRFAHGRIPRWARGGMDTGDVVQDVLVRAFGRLDTFEPRQRQALRSYLRRAVRNRITDEVRRQERVGPPEAVDPDALPSNASPLSEAVASETRRRYMDALARLSPADREAVVARLELNYSYKQIALMTGRETPDAARMAVKRVLLRIAEDMDAR